MILLPYAIPKYPEESLVNCAGDERFLASISG